jgi:hypothetical protein
MNQYDCIDRVVALGLEAERHFWPICNRNLAGAERLFWRDVYLRNRMAFLGAWESRLLRQNPHLMRFFR